MKKNLILIVLFLALSQCGVNRDAEKLIFSDEFDTLDLKTWRHDITLGGGGNWEFEMYYNNRSNSYAKDGVLFIQPTLTADNIGEGNVINGFTYDIWGASPADQCTGNAFYGCSRSSGAGGNYLNPTQSAKLTTVDSFSFTYGRVEFRAKLPKGDWLWPALWLLPRNNQYGNWPASGEIDVMESRGNANYPNCGVNCFGSTLHFGPAWNADSWDKTHQEYTMPSGDFNQDFHTFGLYWGPDQIYTYLDDDSHKILQVDTKTSFWDKGGWKSYSNPWQYSKNLNAPFDQDFYIIMNVAVGGASDYWPEGVGKKPWVNTDPHSVNAFYSAKGAWYPTWKGTSAMQVDSVKVWSIANDEVQQ